MILFPQNIIQNNSYITYGGEKKSSLIDEKINRWCWMTQITIMKIYIESQERIGACSRVVIRTQVCYPPASTQPLKWTLNGVLHHVTLAPLKGLKLATHNPKWH